MDLNFTLIFFLSASVTFLSFTFSAVYLFNNYKYGLNQRLLGLVLICISYIYLIQHLNINFSIYFVPHIFRTGTLASIIAVSLLFLVLKKQITHTKFSKLDMWHTVPLLLYIVNFAPFFVQSTAEKREILNQIKEQGDFYLFNEGWLLNEDLSYMLFALNLLVYFLSALYLFQKYKHKLNQKSPSVTLLKWYLTVLFVVFITLIWHYFNIFSLKNTHYANVVYYSISLITLLYLFFNYKFLFGHFFSEENKKTELQLVDQKLAQSALTTLNKKKQNCLTVIKKIEENLKESKIYLNANFSLNMLAISSGVSTNKISKCIKNTYKVNFNQYINAWRVQYLIDQLKVDKKMRSFNNDALVVKIGFNSASSFYTSFKSFTGFSPREFIDNLIENEQKAN